MHGIPGESGRIQCIGTPLYILYSKDYIFVSEQDIHIWEGFQDFILVELAQERSGQVDRERLSALVRILGDSHDCFKTHSEEKTLLF
jgi:hypothetical protein